MRSIVITFTLLPTLFFGQSNQIDSLEFCKQKFYAPCSAPTAYELKCDNYNTKWFYMIDEMLDYVPQEFIRELELKQDFKKEPVSCSLLGQDCKAYLVSYKNDKGKAIFKLIAFGKINNQALLFQHSQDTEIKSNADMPDFVKQIANIQSSH